MRSRESARSGIQLCDGVGDVHQFAAHGVAGPAGSTACRQWFQELPDFRDVRQLGEVHTGGEGPAARVGNHQVVHLQPLDRLAHRGAAEAELGGQLPVVDRLARPDLQHDQLVAQLPVGGLRLGQRLVLGGGQGRKCIQGTAPFCCSVSGSQPGAPCHFASGY